MQGAYLQHMLEPCEDKPAHIEGQVQGLDGSRSLQPVSDRGACWLQPCCSAEWLASAVPQSPSERGKNIKPH